MKNYKNYTKEIIAMSDVAQFTVTASPKSLFAETKKMVINTGRDGVYRAYIVDGDAEIGNHYKLVLESNNELIFESEERIVFKGNNVRFYRAGNEGFIVQVL